VAETGREPLDDDAIVTFVVSYMERNGIGAIEGVGVDTPFEELGLDSITTTGLLIAARQELIIPTGLPGTATLREVPPLERVGDLAALLRKLCAADA
jgi:Phosphopantetheine attachment site